MSEAASASAMLTVVCTSCGSVVTEETYRIVGGEFTERLEQILVKDFTHLCRMPVASHYGPKIQMYRIACAVSIGPKDETGRVPMITDLPG